MERARILVVDDDPMLTMLAAQALGAEGFDVAVAEHARAALASLEEQRPDLILLDVCMPETNGLEVCRRIRDLPGGGGIPIVMLTSLDDHASMRAAFAAGATDFVTKPVNYGLLAHRVRYILRAALDYRSSRAGASRFAVVQRLARLAQWELELDGGRFRWSPEANAVFGVADAGSWSDLRALLERVHPDDYARVEATLQAGASHAIDYRLVDKSGRVRQIHQEAELVVDETGGVCLVGAAQDLTDLREVERGVIDLAYFDHLTGLPNRLFFREFLERALTQAERGRRAAAVLSIDLDLFKRVNDMLGQAGGDTVLREAAARILSSIRAASDSMEHRLAARLGADEFVVALADVADGDEVAAIARRIVEQFRESFTIGEHQMFVSVSVGVAMFPEHGTAADTLLERADAAMHDIKERSRNGVHFFTPSIHERARRRLELESGLREALNGARESKGPSELALHYQPKVGVPSGRVMGVEALLRWTRASGGISPAEFIPVAEETGLIVSLGEWVLRTACFRAKQWADDGRPLRVAVNVSARQFRTPGFVATVEDALRDSGLAASSLELEITEGLVMEDSEASGVALTKLRALGVRIALDDFGTGYSSLSYLTWLPIDSLKIDRAFVRHLGRAKTDTIMQAILSLSRGLGIDVVAEGVETESQLAFLTPRGPLDIQGFLFAKPMPEAALMDWLARHDREPPPTPELSSMRETTRPRREPRHASTPPAE